MNKLKIHIGLRTVKTTVAVLRSSDRQGKA